MLGRFTNITQITRYNGYNFPDPAGIETLAYKITPVYDAARRTVVYSVFDITIKWFVAGNSTLSAEIRDMVARLQAPGGILRYTRSLGVAEQVNRGDTWDVDWGPRPGPVQLKLHGAEAVVECTWQVQFSLPTCDDAVYTHAVREYGFTVEYERGRDGLTTRTFKAHVSIAVTRRKVNDRTIRHCRPALDSDHPAAPVGLPAPKPELIAVGGQIDPVPDGGRCPVPGLRPAPGVRGRPPGARLRHDGRELHALVRETHRHLHGGEKPDHGRRHGADHCGRATRAASRSSSSGSSQPCT